MSNDIVLSDDRPVTDDHAGLAAAPPSMLAHLLDPEAVDFRRCYGTRVLASLAVAVGGDLAYALGRAVAHQEFTALPLGWAGTIVTVLVVAALVALTAIALHVVQWHGAEIPFVHDRSSARSGH